MMLEETKCLIRTNGIIPNKVLGQNFLVDSTLYPKLCHYADLKPRDVVLDVGAGFGFLARFLAEKCKSIIAIEKDPRVAQVLREQVKDFKNIMVIKGDVLKTDLPDFNKVISFPPYYLSSKLVSSLLDRGFDCALMIVQMEFASRLVAPVGSEDYGWISVVVFQVAEAELLDSVPKFMFLPEPEVDSIVVRLKPWATAPFTVTNKAFFKRLVRWLFAERNKKLTNALVPFLRYELKISKSEAEKRASEVQLFDKRVRELAPKEFGELANVLCR